jgi:sugar phosphate isomerase/epimerase
MDAVRGGMMRFGYSTNVFVRHSLFQAVEMIAKLGFGGVEIMCDRPHLYPPDFGAGELECVKRLIEEKGLKITNLNSFTLFAVGDTYLPSWIERETGRRETRVEHTRQCLRLASYFGCANISVPPGGPVKGIRQDEAMELFRSGLEQVVPLAEELGVRLLVEPEPGLLIENTRQFSEFIRGMQSRAVGLNFDIGHFFCAGEDPSVAMEELFEWIGHIHIEDIAAARIHRHLIPGHGAIGFPKVLQTMARLRYEGDVSLELYPYVDMPEEAGREGREYLLHIFEEAGLALEGGAMS